ncbi:MAG: YhjD/YihY/BrkB family envelope integrity protein, partial [Atopobiaceae bacterium]|nr:YhjD/YihY/BrkB family envelope integrity protein [Atopobiaceae bacterium]
VLGYTFLPVGKRKIANQLPGAVFAVLACGVLSFGFRIYVDNYSSYSSLYGSIATVALFLYWMYLLGHVLIMGGFINWFLEERREKASGE